MKIFFSLPLINSNLVIVADKYFFVFLTKIKEEINCLYIEYKKKETLPSTLEFKCSV